MKLDNKEITKIIDENVDVIDSIGDIDFEVSPCFEVKIDKEKNRMIFLIDKTEKLSASLSKYKKNEITVNLLSRYLKLLREGNMDELKKAVKR